MTLRLAALLGVLAQGLVGGGLFGGAASVLAAELRVGMTKFP